MRVMLKATLDTEKSTEVLHAGKMQDLLGQAMERIHPEAAYFGPDEGRRTCFLVFDMKDSSELPPTIEPFFSELGARAEVFPVMTLDDLKKGLSQLP